MEKKKKINVFSILRHVFLFPLVVVSCQKNDSLSFSLEQSGGNRVELEKVLNHYKGDSLKYQSAVFLIENMPHYSYEVSPEIDSMKFLLSKVFNDWNITEEEKQKGISWQKNKSSSIKYDIEEITSEILIENIDLAFEVWKKPWNKNLSFEDFCELILPYRIAEEPLTQWRKKYYDKYNPIMDSLYQGTNPVEACNALAEYLEKEKTYYFVDFSTPRQGADFQLKNRIGSCRDFCDIATYAMRSVGIPVTTDFYPYSPEYKLGHEWNVVRDTLGKYRPFWYGEFKAEENNKFTDKRKKGKVYRMCYSKQKEEDLSEEPSILQNAFIKDVTSDYFGENTIKIRKERKNIRNIYLGIFTARNGWLIVDKGEIDKDSLIFKNIEPYVFYQPLTIKNNEKIPVGFPFMYKKNEIHIYSPSQEKHEITLTRKYPLREKTALYKKWLIGVDILGYNSKNSVKKDTLYHIKKVPKSLSFNLKINTNNKYKYFQYKVPKDSTLSIAELHFFNSENNEILFKDKYSDGNPWKNVDLYRLKNAFDNDPLSFFHTFEKGTSIFFESERPLNVKRISITPRNDDNFIRKGDLYELFYNNGNKGWGSLGRKLASDNSLNFIAPKNSVLWLRNLTRGIEEQIFTYQSGKQIFPTFTEYGK